MRKSRGLPLLIGLRSVRWELLMTSWRPPSSPQAVSSMAEPPEPVQPRQERAPGFRSQGQDWQLDRSAPVRCHRGRYCAHSCRRRPHSGEYHRCQRKNGSSLPLSSLRWPCSLKRTGWPRPGQEVIVSRGNPFFKIRTKRRYFGYTPIGSSRQ